jgi:SAM-dependent methyltransferase
MIKNWFIDWFASDFYQTVYNHRNISDANKLIELIISKTNLNKKSWVLDAACGFGRHSQIFAEKYMNVVGFDLSKTLLLRAKENLIDLDNSFLFRGDIRNVFLKKKFDLISNLFTSFGYFESDEENFSFVKNSTKFIKEDGFFVFDYFNQFYLEKNLIPSSEKEVNGIKISEKREIKNKRIVKEIVIKNGKTDKFYESVKLYSKDEIIDHFGKYGYQHRFIFGDYDGNNFDEELSERLVIFFTL